MKRHALLIGSPGERSSPYYLRGVEFDVLNYVRFLRSSTGGAWNKDEITAVKNPEKNGLIRFIQALDVDYLLIVFSGHGATSATQQMHLVLKDNQTISLLELLSKSAGRQMMILDACRTFVDSGLSGFLGEELRTFPSQLNRARARRIFDNHLRACEPGVIVSFSCSLGETSLESNDGGYFTTSLLDTTNQWVNTSSKFSILTAYQAVMRARTFINSRLTATQHPIMQSSPQRKMWFPLAVRSPNHFLFG